MEASFIPEDPVSWRAGFDDGLAGRRSPVGNKVAYRSGYLAGSARRISRRTMMATALAAVTVPTTSALPQSTLENDPILAAIDQHRHAWKALNAATEDDDLTRLHATVLTAESAIVDTRPVTPAGVLALRKYHREQHHPGGYEIPPPPYYPYRGWSGKG